MKPLPAFAAVVSLGVLSACGSAAEDQAAAIDNRVEQQPSAGGATTGAAVAPSSLSEMQLLDADLVTADGTELGEVEQVRRNAAGAIEGVLVEIENSSPDRYVFVPITGLTTRVRGDDIDLQTTMTAADLAAMPDARR